MNLVHACSYKFSCCPFFIANYPPKITIYLQRYSDMCFCWNICAHFSFEPVWSVEEVAVKQVSPRIRLRWPPTLPRLEKIRILWSLCDWCWLKSRVGCARSLAKSRQSVEGDLSWLRWLVWAFSTICPVTAYSLYSFHSCCNVIWTRFHTRP